MGHLRQRALAGGSGSLAAGAVLPLSLTHPAGRGHLGSVGFRLEASMPCRVSWIKWQAHTCSEGDRRRKWWQQPSSSLVGMWGGGETQKERRKKVGAKEKGGRKGRQKAGAPQSIPMVTES